MLSFLGTMFATFMALIPIVNPFSTTSVFLSFAAFGSKKWRNTQIKLAVLYMMLILISFLLFGSFIISFFGISMPGMRIAGGILVSKMALGMLYGHEEEPKSSKNIMKKDIAFFPLAMPSLAGPGSIALVISMGTLVGNPINYLAIIAGIFMLGLLTFAVLKSSSYFKDFIKGTGMMATTKIMGFINFCIGVQFVINGLMELAKSLPV